MQVLFKTSTDKERGAETNFNASHSFEIAHLQFESPIFPSQFHSILEMNIAKGKTVSTYDLIKEFANLAILQYLFTNVDVFDDGQH